MAELMPGWQTFDGKAPVADAFHVERVIDPFQGQETIGMVRHASVPFVQAAPDATTAPHDRWFGLAGRYLGALRDRLSAAPGVRGWPDDAIWASLIDGVVAGQDGGGGFGWLPITWGLAAATGTAPDAEPIGSFWVPRRADAQPLTDGTLVLLAGRVVYGQTDSAGQRHKALLLAGDSGLRLSLQVSASAVGIRGVTFSGLASARALAPFPGRLDQRADALFALVKALRAPIQAALGQGRHPWLRVLEPLPGQPGRLRAAGHALRPRRATAASADGAAAGERRRLDRAAIHDFAVEVDVTDPDHPRVLQVLRNQFAGSAADRRPARRPDAAPDAAPGTGRPAGGPPDGSQTPPVADQRAYRAAQVFLHDPASHAAVDPHTGAPRLQQVRPSRDESQLEKVRQPIELLLDTEGRLAYQVGPGAQHDQRLHETRAGRPQGSTWLDAAGTWVDDGAVVRLGRDAGPAPKPALWSDRQAAVEAHQRACELFTRLDAYGIDPFGHFRFAKLPLVQRARGSTRWAPEADLPYAEVRPFLGDDAAGQGASPMARPQLLVKYGSADPMQRRMVEVGSPDARGRRRQLAQYLGVASDPRWAWHEFGHVLNYAATGELEFPFAHSAGDALGAIVADPLSALAQDNHAPLRFASFPWIEVPGRSHGRSAYEGYCWCGRRNLVRLARVAPLERHHHGYFEEQILSTCLFRLYRCLGGDTRGGAGADDRADAEARLAASDFTVALVIRAISLLGPDGVAPARTADQFVSALVDADAGLGDWSIDADWPLDRPERQVQRQGGLAHKVIRWAFEQQGLDAADSCTAIVDGPGRPPVVDLFIADGRPAAQPGAAAGGYAPVALRHGDPTAAWHAEAGALVPVPGGVWVHVRNRGRGPQPAVGLALRAWWAPAVAAGAPLVWTEPIAGASTTDAVAAGGDASVLLQHPHAEDLAPGRDWWAVADGWLLVAVDTPADPSNLPAGKTPPTDPQALMHLVAQDNNLALRRWMPAMPAASG